MTVVHEDPLCPHGVPGWTACDTCLDALAGATPPWPWDDDQEDTPRPDPTCRHGVSIYGSCEPCLHDASSGIPIQTAYPEGDK